MGIEPEEGKRKSRGSIAEGRWARSFLYERKAAAKMRGGTHSVDCRMSRCQTELAGGEITQGGSIESPKCNPSSSLEDGGGPPAAFIGSRRPVLCSETATL